MGEKKRRLAAQATGVQAAATAGFNTPAAGSIAGSAVQTLTHARQFLQAGKLVNAINVYQQVLRADGLNPQHQAEALHFQGLALLQAGQAVAGISLMRQALGFDDANPLYQFNLGLALAENDVLQALPFLRRAWELQPGDTEMTRTLADALLHNGQRKDALAVLQAGPVSAALLDLRAQLHYAENQLPAAQNCFARATALNPALMRQRRIGFAAPTAGARTESRLLAGEQAALDTAGGPRPAWPDQAALDAWLAELDLHILDDCLPDPLAYRQQALQLPFHAERYAGQNYPGLQTDGQNVAALMQVIANQLGKTIKYISPDNGSYRVSFADSVARSDIHVDNESGAEFVTYAAVLYLNLPQQCQGGTRFWQHQASGWRRRLPEDAVRQAGYADFKSFQQRWLPRHEAGAAFNAMQQQRRDWLPILDVPMQFNRLIMYRGDYFHSIGEVFGDDLQNARLVQLFFFDVIP